jgi:peroxiredoxin
MTTVELGDVVPDVPVLDSGGREVRLHDYLEGPTVLQLLRYYG